MVIEEHARLEILLPGESSWRYIDENDIINNSLSIISKCMDDSSFSIGGVYSAQLSVKIRLSGTNSYNVAGAKIKVYSHYDNDSEHLRGVFWATSVSRIKDIYSISASDSIVWLDTQSYNDNSSNSENMIQGYLCEYRYGLNSIFAKLLEFVNILLKRSHVVGFDDDVLMPDINGDSGIINNYTSEVGYTLLKDDEYGQISSKNPRDFASWIAQIACGFIFMKYDDGFVRIRIGQFWEDGEVSISFDEVELDSCEIADYTIGFKRVYAEIYDGSSGSWYNDGFESDVTVDLSGNPFIDGHYQYNDFSAMDILKNIYDKLCGNEEKNCHGLPFRPFKLKCHCKKYFELGQKIRLPDGNISWLTSIKWQFRGGYTLSCAGKDTRTLCNSARRSQAVRAKESAYTKINNSVAILNKEINEIRNKINGGE